MTGRGAAALCHEVRVTFRRARAHEQFAAPAGYRPIVAIADTLDGREEMPWAVPHREAKRVLNPRYKQPARDLVAGIIPTGWQRL